MEKPEICNNIMAHKKPHKNVMLFYLDIKTTNYPNYSSMYIK